MKKREKSVQNEVTIETLRTDRNNEENFMWHNSVKQNTVGLNQSEQMGTEELKKNSLRGKYYVEIPTGDEIEKILEQQYIPIAPPEIPDMTATHMKRRNTPYQKMPKLLLNPSSQKLNVKPAPLKITESDERQIRKTKYEPMTSQASNRGRVKENQKWVPIRAPTKQAPKIETLDSISDFQRNNSEKQISRLQKDL